MCAVCATPLGATSIAMCILFLRFVLGFDFSVTTTVLVFSGLSIGIIATSRFYLDSFAEWTEVTADLVEVEDAPKVPTFMEHVCADKTARKLLIFLAMNISFMFAEVVYGWVSNSLGLLSDAFHMLFDCIALTVSLYASYMGTWPADRAHSYGFIRYEVLAGFANALFLVFIGCSIALEAFGRIQNPPTIAHIDELIVVSILGLVVNLIGVVFFHEFHTHAGSSEDGCECCVLEGGAQDNMQGVFLHILADTLSSVGVTLAAVAIKYKGWLLADAACSIFISGLIICSVFPLLQKTSATLVQRSALDAESLFASLLSMPSVYGYRDPHTWSMAGKQIVCSVRLLVLATASEQGVLLEATRLCHQAGYRDVAIQVTPRAGPFSAWRAANVTVLELPQTDRNRTAVCCKQCILECMVLSQLTQGCIACFRLRRKN